MSALDGHKVSFRYRSDMIGIVQGDSFIPGTVRVQWLEPDPHTGVHQVRDLVDIPQEETEDDRHVPPPGYYSGR